MTVQAIPNVVPASAQAERRRGVGDSQPSAAQYVDALNDVFGAHPCARASHAKGVSVVGNFVPTGAAAEITSAVHLQKDLCQVVGRFSVGGGNPQASDKAKTVRGFALRFWLPSGNSVDLVMISAPVFFVAKAEHFIPYLQARRPDPITGKPDPARVHAFNAQHPDTKPQIDYLNATPVPASYASTAYWAVNAFKFTRPDGLTVHGRWRAEPVSGRVGLSAEELALRTDDFLEPDLQMRLLGGPIEFDLWVQVALPDDDPTNPTIEWPEDRHQINVGRVTIHSLADTTADDLVYNPVNLPAGIAPSADPILQVRLPAYAESLERRMMR